jgi:vacuolar-type H+-ATPase subunit E/Vma4
MKHSGLKNENFVDKLNISGSTAIRTKNDFGVHIFSGSISDDGVIGSTLVKPKYNIGEIEKSIDTTIVELIPITTPELPDTVLLSVYNVALSQIDDLTEEVARLNGVVLSLQSDITELEIVTQSLRVQLDAKDITIATIENQNEQLSFRIQSSIIDLQNSIQRATSEAIQRVSLTARNESLLQENDSLKDELQATRERLENTIKDLQKEASVSAQLADGAFGGGDLTANPTPISDSSISEIAWRGRPRGNYRDGRFINGNSISIFNPTDSDVRVTFTQTNIDFLQTIPPVTVRAKGFANVNLKVDVTKVDKYKRGVDTLTIGALSIASPSATISIPMELQIQRGKNYRRPNN